MSKTRKKTPVVPGLKAGEPTTAARGGSSRPSNGVGSPGFSPGTPDNSLQPVHLLILAVMIAATAVALIAHGTSLQNLVFIMLAVVAAGVVTVAVYRTAVPLVADVPIAQPEMLGGRTRAALEREKTTVLRAIKELEFDRAMGKVSDADCEEMTARLRARAVRLIRQLDVGGAGYRDLIQRELNARLGNKPAAGAAAEVQVAANAGGQGE